LAAPQAVKLVHLLQPTGHFSHLAVPLPKYPSLQVAQVALSETQDLQLATQFSHLPALIPFPEVAKHSVQVALSAAHNLQEASSHFSQTSVFNLYPALQPPELHLPAAEHVEQFLSH